MPVILPLAHYDAADGLGYDMAGYAKSEPMAMTGQGAVSRSFAERNPIEKMNRQQRRRHLRELGYTWGQAREAAKRATAEQALEAGFIDKALRLTPAEARAALEVLEKRDAGK